MHRLRYLVAALSLLTVVAISTPEEASAATVIVKGSWHYWDHDISLGGVSSQGRLKPVRGAQVQIQHWTGSQWLPVGSGVFTANGGGFSTTLTDGAITIGSTRLRSLVCFRSSQGRLIVNKPAGGLHCYQSAAKIAQSTVDFGALKLPDTEVAGGAANIFDTLVDAQGYMLQLTAGWPSAPLTVVWQPGNTKNGTTGSAYVPETNLLYINGVITDRDPKKIEADHWSESVILHEVGHWLMYQQLGYKPQDGDHGSCTEADVNPTLAYPEGWSTFFSSAVRRASFDFPIQTLAQYHLDTKGGIGSPVFALNLEAIDKDTPDLVSPSTGKTGHFLDPADRGNFCEWQIAAMLWDVIDTNTYDEPYDTLQEPVGDVFTAYQTLYNGHPPHNINQWWYGWTNTLGDRTTPTSASMGSEPAMLANFAGHGIDVGVKIELRWTGNDLDLDSHLWLPQGTNQSHIRFDQLGSATVFPFASLDQDLLTGDGVNVPASAAEQTWIVSPYKGTYHFAVFDWTDRADDSQGIARSGAQLVFHDGSELFPSKCFVPTEEAGDWWDALDIDGWTGRITGCGWVRTSTSASYDPDPGQQKGSIITCASSVPIGAYCAEYYEGRYPNGSLAFVNWTEPAPLNYDWGNGGPLWPCQLPEGFECDAQELGPDQFSAVWRGRFNFDDGTYTFSATTDDGMRVWVDGFLLIDAWYDQPPTTYTAPFAPGAGEHQITVEYYESGGGATARVDWEQQVQHPPVAPDDVQIGATTSTSIEVRWADRSDNESKFEVAYRKVGASSWTYLDLSPDRTNWVHESLGPNESYTYFVRACNGAGCSSWIGGISGTTQAVAGQLRVVTALTLTDTTLVAPQQIRASFTVENVGGETMTIQELAAGARRGSDWSGELADFPYVTNITLAPGARYTYSQWQTFQAAGEYFAEPVVKLNGERGSFGDSGNRVSFAVTLSCGPYWTTLDGPIIRQDHGAFEQPGQTSVYCLEAQKGTWISVRAFTYYGRDFNPYLEIVGPDGTLLVANDDGQGIGRNAFVSVQLPQWGYYKIMVRNIGSRSGGSYMRLEAGREAAVGDINRDCVVNTTDDSLLQAAFDTANPDADLDLNGIVNVLDYNIWLTNNGVQCP